VFGDIGEVRGCLHVIAAELLARVAGKFVWYITDCFALALMGCTHT
jgi:hypothetical protein